MEALLTALLERIPVAGAVIITIWLFHRQQRHLSKEWRETVTRISKESTNCQKNCTTVVMANSKVLGQVAGLIEKRIKQNGG